MKTLYFKIFKKKSFFEREKQELNLHLLYIEINRSTNEF